MFKIGIVQFPGANCDYDAAKAVKAVGMKPVMFKWNDDYRILEDSDGTAIPGGFTHQDRGYAGDIAAQDDLMNVIKRISGGNLPVLGICNGAQIGVNAKLVTGMDDNALDMAYAKNHTPERSGITSFINRWVHVKNFEAGRTAFTLTIRDHDVLKMPVAHGEGRFDADVKTLEHLIENCQVVFRYCDKDGGVSSDYPINPNGAMYNVAGICNKKGNVLLMMPHPERMEYGKNPEGFKLFESMRVYLENGCLLDYAKSHKHEKPAISIEFFVDWLTIDNEAHSVGEVAKRYGCELHRQDYWRIDLRGEQINALDMAERLIRTSEFIKTTKHLAYIKLPNGEWRVFEKTKVNPSGEFKDYAPQIKDNEVDVLTYYKKDSEGEGLLHRLQKGWDFGEVVNARRGTFWKLLFADAQSKSKYEDIRKSNLLSHPVSMVEERYL